MKYVPLAKPPRSNVYFEGDGGTLLPGVTVYEKEDAPEDTGLLDASGVKLYRIRERIKMGFVK